MAVNDKKAEPHQRPDSAAPWTIREREYPPRLQERERELLQRRREGLKQAGVSDSDRPAVGFALSGGGIRSATFCLGVFQALAARGLLSRIDYLSTVSGGGYFGSFLGRMFARDYADIVTVQELIKPKADAHSVPIVPAGKRPDPVRLLRDSSRYLAPNGSSDLLSAIAILLRNWVAVQVVVFTFVLAIFLGLQLLTWAVPPMSAGTWGPLWVSPVTGAIGLAALLLVVPLGWAYWLASRLRLSEVHPIAGLAFAAALGWYGPEILQYVGLPPEAGLGTFLRGLLIVSVATFLFWLRAITLAAKATVVELGEIDAKRYFDVQPRPALMVEEHSDWVTLLFWIAAACGVAFWRLDATYPRVSGALAIAGGVAVALYAFAWIGAYYAYWRAETRAGVASGVMHRYRDDEMRNTLTEWLAAAIAVTLFLAALALIDTLGLTLYAKWVEAKGFPWQAIVGAVAAATPLLLNLDRLAAVFRNESGPRAKLPPQLVAVLVALLAGTAVLVAGDALSHAFAWRFATPSREWPPQWELPVAAFATAAFASWLFARTWAFLNRSAQHHFYASRLTRAYLGASNRDREGTGVTLPVPGDDISDADYWDGRVLDNGGPLHLVNVTINETASTTDRTVNRDRKGIGLAIGPAGLSAGARHHALLVRTTAQPNVMARVQNALAGSAFVHNVMNLLRRPDVPPAQALLDENARRELEPLISPTAGGKGSNMFGFKRSGNKDVESLSLGQWTAISGAAFSTGLGSRTSMAVSLLLGLANVRLGYWWRSGSDAHLREVRRRLSRQFGRLLRDAFPVQRYLLDEFTATFHGADDPHWYLTDGGHFENMGAYELVRRRLPLIVIVDGEADPTYTYEGLANLVRKARLDFRAEITFLDRDGARNAVHPALQPLLGSLDDLRPDRRGFSTARAALALIRYPDEAGRKVPPSLLLYLKPTLRPDDAVDVRHYKAMCGDFPQESTLDQFFDEAQWESYRRLGERIGTDLFADVGGAVVGRFTPGSLDPAAYLGTQG